MIGYLHKTADGFVLTVCERPCNGEEFQNARKVVVAHAREAAAICRRNGIIPYNFMARVSAKAAATARII